MKPGMKLSVLSVCLREGTVARRMSPKRYLDGILAILRAKRTGTLLVDGWEMQHRSWWSSRRRPTYISLEDVRTFEVEGVDAGDDAEVAPEALSALRAINRDRKAILSRAWMPRS